MIDYRPRLTAVQQLLSLTSSVPQDWIDTERKVVESRNRIKPHACSEWRGVRSAWTKAARWRQGLEDVLVSSLAVAMSTQQRGNEQLCLLVVGPPGASKTRIVSSLLVSEHCYQFEAMSGLLSGWRSGFGDKDYSMLNRINGKCLITPEGDVIVSNPKFPELMGQLRRIYDGSLASDFKTLEEQRRYDGLRTPLIWAGTPKMMLSMNQSQLGDRFIRIHIDEPPPDEERAILLRVINTARRDVRETSNCSAESQMSPEMLKAYQLTGGYVDYLRENAQKLLNNVDRGQGQWVEEYCADLAQFTAYLRTKPDSDPRKRVDEIARRELPTRLAQQYVRMGDCVATVLGKPEVDESVLRLIRKIAIDTTDTKILSLIGNIRDGGENGAYTAALARWSSVTDAHMCDTLSFLESLGTVRQYHSNGTPGSDAYSRWHLSDEMERLWERVHGM